MGNQRSCDYCGKVTEEGAAWVVLNRVVLGSGRSRVLSEFWNSEGEYVWEQDGDGDDQAASGVLLCYPDCLRDFIEGRMIEADIQAGKNG